MVGWVFFILCWGVIGWLGCIVRIIITIRCLDDLCSMLALQSMHPDPLYSVGLQLWLLMFVCLLNASTVWIN